MNNNTKETGGMPDYYARVRQAIYEYKLHHDSPILTAFATFRHHDKVDQDKILNQFREQYPKLYVLLLEIQRREEDYAKFDAMNRMRNFWGIVEVVRP